MNNVGNTVSFKEIGNNVDVYIKNIEFIYEGNDIMYTKVRKANVVKGLIRIKDLL